MSSRRNFIKLSGIASAGAMAVPSLFFSSCRKMDMMTAGAIYVIDGNFDVELPIPEIIDATSGKGLTAQLASANIIKNKITPVWGYYNGILGPTLIAKKGDIVNIPLVNNLPEETNIHWHGLMTPANMDGYPTDVVASGSSFAYSFEITQRAGTYWYHPHPDGKTASQVYQGLAGMFIVNDDDESLLNLPDGDYEIPLVIQDKRLYADFSINYSPTMGEVMTGYMGQYILVNGVYSPYINISTRWYRFRVLNGSNARLYNLALSNNASFYVIGADGGLLTSPESVNSLMLAPGERADLLIDFSSYNINDEIYLKSLEFDAENIQGYQSFNIIKLVIKTDETDSFSLPSSLSNIETIDTAISTYNRQFIIDDMGSMMGMGGMGMMGSHTINGKTFDADRIDATVTSGSTEIWIIDNSDGDEIHPFHVHGLLFQLLERTGGRGALIATEKGWKDTVLLMPKEKVKIIMTFPQNKGKFLLHCHNLEHEDDGMMLNFEII